MPGQPAALRIPERCPNCGAYAKVKLETTVKGVVAMHRWCCTACNHAWPLVGPDELWYPRYARTCPAGTTSESRAERRLILKNKARPPCSRLYPQRPG